MNLQFITHQTPRFDEIEGARQALAGGCRWVQLRMKEAALADIEAKAHVLKGLCREHGAKLLIDDHVEIARRVGADGVHLGKNDMPIAEARAILGADCVIGGTANTVEDALTHIRSGADYLGVGPFRFTATKKNLSPLLGLKGYESLVKALRSAGHATPVLAIGGIVFEDIPALMQTGISGIALSGTILQSEDPCAETARIIEALATNGSVDALACRC